MGVIGSLIGGVLGILIANHLDQIILLLNPAIHLPSLISGLQIAVIVGVSILLSLLCTIYPAYRASKIEPAQALRYE